MPPFTFNLCQNGNFFGSFHFGVSSCRHFVDSLRAGGGSPGPCEHWALWFSEEGERAARVLREGRRDEGIPPCADGVTFCHPEHWRRISPPAPGHVIRAL